MKRVVRHWPAALRVLLGLLMLWAGASKATNPGTFLGDLNGYELGLPRAFLALVAVVLPWIEALCGVMLLTKTRTESALLCTLGLLVVFVGATAQAAVRDLQISCGCLDLSFLGALNLPGLEALLESVGFALGRNLGLLAATISLLARPPPPASAKS